MKKIKLLLLLLPFFLSGCTVQYNLKVNDDLSVEESFIAKVSYGYFNHLEKDVDYANEYFRQVIKEYNSDYLYDWEYLEEKEQYGVKMWRTHETLDSLIGAKTIRNFYEDIEIEENGDFITLKTKGPIKMAAIYTYATETPSEEDNYTYVKIPKDTYFSITVPFEVESSNATRVDKLTNTFYWDVTQDTKDLPIEITFNTNKKFFSLLGTIVQTTKRIDYNILLFLAIVVIIMVLVKKAQDKSKKNNEI